EREKGEEREGKRGKGRGKREEEGGGEKEEREKGEERRGGKKEKRGRRRKEGGKKGGRNLDPAHLMWMGADPIASAR
ncbi:sugar phosphate isomerase/epimerase, partial [Rhizobium ruizarguesonis]